MARKDVSLVIKHHEYLYGMNSNWRSYFDDLANFCLPRKAWINTIRYTGQRLQFNFLYDSEAIRDLQKMSAGFHTHLTNPSTEWFDLQTRDIDLMESYGIRMWLQKVKKIMYATLQNSNFDTTMQEFYNDAGCFGNGTIYVQEDFKEKVRFTLIPVAEVNFEEDARGRVCAMYRCFKMTAIQAYMLWGKDCGEDIVEMATGEKMYEFVDIIHYVGPRERRDFTKNDNLNMEYESLWIAKKGPHLIKESVYNELTYVVGRFYKADNDTFGFSPAMNVLADIKLINAQKKTALRRGMKETDPPLQAPDRGYILPLNLNPSAMNYRIPNVQPDALQAIGVGAGQFSITKDIMEMTINSIREGFFVPLFQALTDVTKEMTVPEVQHRIAENMVLLGPVIGRFTNEVLSPILGRTFNILWRSGMIPPPPMELQDEIIDPIFLGQLARAQKQTQLVNIQTYLQFIGGMATVFPEISDNINPDKTSDVVAKILSVTPEIQRSTDDVKTIRTQRAQVQQQIQQMENAHKTAAIAKTGAEAHGEMKRAEAVK